MVILETRKQVDKICSCLPVFLWDKFEGVKARVIILAMKFLLMLAIVLLCVSCASATPTPLPPPLPTTVSPTATPFVFPTAIDIFYNAPSAYSRQIGNRTQTIRLGVSPDFATRPVLPFYGLSLTDEKFAERLFEAITYNHFFRWQEVDWATRSQVKYDDFKTRLAAGEDLSYPAMDTRAGGANAHIEKINPIADMDILLIPRHDGFVTFPGSQSDPGLSIKNTINADGSVTVRVPLVYAQTISFQAGSAGLQDIARTAVLLALMELGIPSDAIAKNDLKAIQTWYGTFPEKDLHQYQYAYLKKLLTDENEQSILKLWDVKP